MNMPWVVPSHVYTKLSTSVLAAICPHELHFCIVAVFSSFCSFVVNCSFFFKVYFFIGHSSNVGCRSITVVVVFVVVSKSSKRHSTVHKY